MKTIHKHFQKAGNISLVQFGTLEGEGLDFLPAAPAIDKGDLVIRELRQEGTVNTLLAINLTDNRYLLTDMDLLKGAKQNRAVNTSVLIAGCAKQEVDVSCVERSRWSYDSETFNPGPELLDQKMRAAKADSLREDQKEQKSGTQSKIWSMINEELVSHNFISETEDYSSLLESRDREPVAHAEFVPEDDCNGLAVFEGKKLITFDIYGNRETYAYYFERLASGVLLRKGGMPDQESMGKAEAFYRLDEFLDHFESKLETVDGSKDHGPGVLQWSGDQDYPGFRLDLGGQLLHQAGFARV